MDFGGGNDLDRNYLGGGGDDADAWSMSRFQGDWYREPDDVVRGVPMSMAQVPDSFGSPYDFGGFSVDADFYRDAEDPCKGLSTGIPGEPAFFGSIPMPGELQGKLDPGWGFEPAALVHSERRGTVVEPFTEADAPPKMPSGPLATLEKTCVKISTTSAHLVGNALLDFLADHAVIKANRKKFTIKANAFFDGVMCTLKIRVYKQEHWGFHVELQHRAGDRICFGKTFDEAESFLVQRFGNLVKLPAKEFQSEDDKVTLRPPPKDLNIPAADVSQAGPLLDMAACSELAQQQAEAAVALAEIAQDSRAASALCTRAGFEAFKALAQSESPAVAQPTGQLLSCITPCSEAARYLADDELLSAIIDKVRDGVQGPHVRMKFVHVLKDAMDRCASALSAGAAANVNAALDKAVRSPSVDKKAKETMQEIQLTLAARDASGRKMAL